MSDKFIDSSLLDKAIIFSVNAHKNIERKGQGFPYVVHPLEAVSIVATLTSDQELLAAAALHDVIEDTSFTADDLKKQFGARVANLVVAESDVYHPGESSEDSWHRRKQEAIDRIRKSSRDEKIVAMGDKLSNMRAIARDYAKLGDKLWDRFHEKRREEHEWHYRGLAWALEDLSGTFAYKEFLYLLNSVFSNVSLINLSDYTLSGEGFTAESYNHVSSKTMIKLYKPYIPVDVIKKEVNFAQKVASMGIMTPKAYRFVTDGSRYGSEFERISPKFSFSRFIADNPEKLESTAILFAQMAKKLHTTECDTSFFPYGGDLYKKYIEESILFSKSEKERMVSFIDTIKPATTSLHGDFHIGNIITNGEGNCWWIDLGDFSYGDPRFDLGRFYAITNLVHETISEHVFHLKKDKLKEIWRIFIREYMGTNDEDKVLEYENSIKPFAALTLIYFSNLDRSISDELKTFVLSCF